MTASPSVLHDYHGVPGAGDVVEPSDPVIFDRDGVPWTKFGDGWTVFGDQRIQLWSDIKFWF